MCGALRAPTSNCVVLRAQGESGTLPPGQEGWIRHSASLYKRHSASLYTHGKVSEQQQRAAWRFSRTNRGGARSTDNWYSRGLIARLSQCSHQPDRPAGPHRRPQGPAGLSGPPAPGHQGRRHQLAVRGPAARSPPGRQVRREDQLLRPAARGAGPLEERKLHADEGAGLGPGLLSQAIGGRWP
jgi:hypothetical protein